MIVSSTSEFAWCCCCRRFQLGLSLTPEQLVEVGDRMEKDALSGSVTSSFVLQAWRLCWRDAGSVEAVIFWITN